MRRRSIHVLLAGLLAFSAAIVPGMVAPDRAAAADPTPTTPMAGRLEAGHHTGYEFDLSTGAIVSTKTVVVSTPRTVEIDRRASIAARGFHLRVTSGTFAGYWLRESIMSYVVGATIVREFDPPRTITLPAGSVLGYRFSSSSGSLISARLRTFESATTATATGSAVINGTKYFAVADGPLADRWVAAGGELLARRLSCYTGPRAGGSAAVWSRIIGAGREVALTFDLGGRTEPAIAIAKRLLVNGVCATVFPTGDAAASTAGAAILELMDNYPAVFEFGNHTKDHCDLVVGGGDTGCPAGKPSSSFIRSQLTSADASIFGVTGQHTAPYWRPPYGAHDAAARSAAASVGYTKTVMWHVDTIDWKPPPPTDTGPTTVQIIDKVVGNVTTGSIVLMHLGGWNTYDALPGIIDGLRGRDVLPTSISDLADGR